ncbi:MAG: hypothetical protein AABY13_06165, partial [Nanoarchaeota archaeon]
AIIVVIIPYSQNNLQSVDTPGHLVSAQYVRDVLWPSPIGWDHRFFGGHPLNQFYGPLLSWIVALLGKFIELSVAFKLVMAVAVLATPLSIYYCARSASMRPLAAALASALIFGLMAARHNSWLGSDYFCVFFLGFVGNGIANPLLFLYIGAVYRDIPRDRYALPALLLALTSLAHIYVGMSALVFTACYFFAAGHRWATVKHVALAGALLGFWALPLVAKLRYTDSSIGAVIYLTIGQLGLFVLVATAVSIYYLTKKRRTTAYPLIMYFAALLALFAAGMMFRLQVQLYRFYLPALMIGTLLCVYALGHLKDKRYLSIAGVLALLLLAASYGEINYKGGVPHTWTNFSHVDGLVLTRAISRPWHLDMLLADKNEIVRGLYAESSLNARFYWMFEDQMKQVRPPSNLKKKLNFFGINWMLTEYPGMIPYKERINATPSLGNNYSLYRIANSSRAQVLDYVPTTVSGPWQKEALAWFDSSRMGTVVVHSQEPLPVCVGTTNETAVVEEVSSTRIRVRVSGSKDVPVFLKFSYFPNWHVYVNGKPTRIYWV